MSVGRDSVCDDDEIDVHLASTPTKSLGRDRAAGIEILRALAALGVVASHVWVLGGAVRFPGDWIVLGFAELGVTVFFVLSSYLLADHFWTGDRRGRLRRFYIRRVLRLAPAYYASVFILYLSFAQRSLVYSRAGLEQVIANITFTHYLRPETASNLNVNGVYWTLTLEAMLYLLMPFLAWITRRTHGWAAVGMIVVGLGYRIIIGRSGDGLQTLYFGANSNNPTARLFLRSQFLGVLPLFGLGIGLKWLVARWGGECKRSLLRRSSVSTNLVLLLVPATLFMVFGPHAAFYTNWVWFAFFGPTIGILVAPAVLFSSGRAEGTGRADAALTWLGVRSYGLYLWHFPLILIVFGRGPLIRGPSVDPLAVKLTLVAVLSTGAAALSWAAVERPAQRLARHLTRDGDTTLQELPCQAVPMPERAE